MTLDSIWPFPFSYDFNGDATADLVRVFDRSVDTLERPSGYQLKNGGTIEATASYQYSPSTGRLESVGNGTDTFTYAYTTNSSLLASVTKSGTPTIQTTHTWEPNRNVLDVKENKVGSTVIPSYDYAVNTLGQRTAVDTAGTAFAAGERDRTWSYDALGQVTAEGDANNTAYHRGFAYDAIGNRLASIEGNTDPTQPGATTYTPTALNQYSQISVPSVPSVVPTYDADGNQLASQIRPLGSSSLESCLFVWDGENRLIEIKDATGTNSLAKYSYDSQSRRIARTVGGTTLATIYDGWNPIAEYSGTPATGYSLQASYSWGLDLSGSMQGAGGVGGLLSVTSGSTSFYPSYDGNGNVSEYLDAAGAIAAHYEYDAFGNVIFSSGPSASSFRHRFSTKPQDAESGLYYYGYRYYDPVTGRWPSRDPIQEDGGYNLFGFLENQPISRFDILGMRPWDNEADAKAAMKKALEDAHNKSLAAGKAEIDARSGKKAEWHTLKDGVGLNHVSTYWSGGGKIADFIEVVLAREFGAETYCFVENGQKKYDHSDPYGAKMPTLAEAKRGEMGTLKVPPNYYSAKEFAPPPRRPTAKLIAEAHTHPEFWKLTLGTPGVDPVRAKTKVGPSRQDGIAAGAIEQAVGQAVEHLVYDDNAAGTASTGYIWHVYGPMP